MQNPLKRTSIKNVESHIFRKLIKEGQIYQAFNSKLIPELRLKNYPNPEQKITTEPKKILPSISQPNIKNVDRIIRNIDFSQNKTPKLNPVLKDHSKKWKSLVKVTEQGKKKNQLGFLKINQKVPSIKIRKSQPIVTISKIVTKGSENPSEVDYFYRDEITPQPHVELLKEKEENNLQSKPNTLQSQQESTNNEHYFKFSESITGWKTERIIAQTYF